MTEHVISHDVVHSDKQRNNVRHHFCFVLVHQFVADREHVFKQKLFLLIMDFLDHLFKLIDEVYAGFGKRV